MRFLEDQIKNGKWTQAWPFSGVEESPVAFDFNPTRSLLGLSLESYWKAAVQLGRPSGVVWEEVHQSALKQVFEDLAAWAEEHAQRLTFPPSFSAWGDALEKTVQELLAREVAPEEGSLEARQVLALAAVFPAAFLLTFPRLENAWDALTQSVPLLGGIQGIPRTAAQVTPSKKPAREVRVEEQVKKKEVPIDADPLGPWLVKIIRNLKAGDWTPPIKKEWLDDKMKWRINQTVPTRTQGQWFEQNLFPILGRLDLDELKTLKEFWPSHRKFNLESPDVWLSSAKFWGTLKNTSEVNRVWIVEELLPLWITLEPLTFEQRLTLGKKVLEYAQKRPDLFEQRLTLWVNLGGGLLETKTQAVEVKPTLESSHLFGGGDPEVQESLASWILLQDNAMWKERLQKIAQTLRVTLPGEPQSGSPRRGGPHSS